MPAGLAKGETSADPGATNAVLAWADNSGATNAVLAA